MSTAVPGFLFSLLDEELRRMQEALLQKVAQEYSLDADTLIKRMLPPKLHLVPDNIKVYRSRPIEPKQGEDACRCKARIWNRGRGGQCTRASKQDDLCSHHQKEMQVHGKLRHGWMHEPPSKELFGEGKKQKALYITTAQRS